MLRHRMSLKLTVLATALILGACAQMTAGNRALPGNTLADADTQQASATTDSKALPGRDSTSEMNTNSAQSPRSTQKSKSKEKPLTAKPFSVKEQLNGREEKRNFKDICFTADPDQIVQNVTVDYKLLGGYGKHGVNPVRYDESRRQACATGWVEWDASINAAIEMTLSGQTRKRPNRP